MRSFAVRHTSGYAIPAHSHDWHQLIYASEGVMCVHTAHGDWVVPPNRAVWVPARVEHGIEMAGTVLVQTLYLSIGSFGRSSRPLLCRQCFAALAGVDHTHDCTGVAQLRGSRAIPADGCAVGSTDDIADDSATAPLSRR